MVERPEPVARGHVAAAPRAHGQERPHAARREHHVLRRDRRGHDAVVGIVAGIETVGAPKLLARGRVVSRDHVAAGHHDLGGALDSHRERRGVGVGRLADGRGLAKDAPAVLAGGRVDAQEVRGLVRLHTVQDLDVERIAFEQRRRGVAPVETERAVLLLEIAGPALLAVEREPLQDPGTGHDVDALAVGHRRRRGHVVLAHRHVAGAEGPLPDHVALDPTDAPKRQVVAVGHVQEDAVAGDDRSRAAGSGQGQRPGHVLGGAPTEGQAGLPARAVGFGPAPLRPIGALRGSSDPGGQGDDRRSGDGGLHVRSLVTARIAAGDGCCRGGALGARAAPAADGRELHGLWRAQRCAAGGPAVAGGARPSRRYGTSSRYIF